MKLQSSTVSALAVFTTTCFQPSGAWAPRPATLHTRHQQLQQRHFSYSNGSLLNIISDGVSALKASVMAEGEATLPGTLIAKGSIVSFFRGGLTAVRIDEDSWDEAAAAALKTGTVLSPTDVPAVEKFKSDAGGDLTGHKVIFPNGQTGVAVAHRPPIVFVYNGIETMETQDGEVSVLKEMATLSVRDEKTVVGWDGTPIDATAADAAVAMFGVTADRAIFAPIPQVKDIALINNPMLTGNTMLDTLAPIGQGQNMLVIADDMGAARGMICDFISTQQRRIAGEGKKRTKFVYAAIDDSEDVMKRMSAAGIADDVHVVLPSSHNKAKEGGDETKVEAAAEAAEATAMAASACAIAESYAIQQGMNTVVIIDTLDQHKKLWDATTRVLVDVFGIESVVKSDLDGGASSEMRGFFSGIVQRSAQYKVNRGGGSVTLLLLCQLPDTAGDADTIYLESDFEGSSEKVRARIELLAKKGIPLTGATLRKIEIPIPSASEGKRRLVLQHIDDLISMSDGQIWLDEKLRAAGQNPPIDPMRSITRIGIGADTQSRADAPALRRIAEGLRLELSQAANMEGAEVTNTSKKQIKRRNALLLAMHQEDGKGGRILSESCTVLLAASSGLLDDAVDSGKLAGSEEGQKIIDGLLKHVNSKVPDVLVSIDDSLDLSPEAKKEVLTAIGSYFPSS